MQMCKFMWFICMHTADAINLKRSVVNGFPRGLPFRAACGMVND